MNYQLWRAGEDGNAFYVDCYPTRELAESALDEYDRRGHKQVYWIEHTKPYPHPLQQLADQAE